MESLLESNFDSLDFNACAIKTINECNFNVRVVLSLQRCLKCADSMRVEANLSLNLIDFNDLKKV